MRVLAVVLVAMFACVGCDKKEASPGTSPEKTTEAKKDVPKPATTPAALVQGDDEDIPTTADFEDAAEKEIDNATVEAEVDKLAKEIGE